MTDPAGRLSRLALLAYPPARGRSQLLTGLGSLAAGGAILIVARR